MIKDWKLFITENIKARLKKDLKYKVIEVIDKNIFEQNSYSTYTSSEL